MQKRHSRPLYPGRVPWVTVAALAWFGLLGFAGGPSAGEEDPRVLTAFGEGPGGWQRRQWQADGSAVIAKLETVAAPEGHTGTWLRLPLAFPSQPEFVAAVQQSWEGWQQLRFRFFFPQDLPEDTVLTLFSKDWDHLWRQIRMPAPPERGGVVAVTVPIAGPEASQQWEPCGHERPWHQLTPRSLLEFGCAIGPDTGSTDPYQGEVLLLDVSLLQPGRVTTEHGIADLRVAPRAPRLGERIEVTFRLTDDYRDPFAAESVRVEAVVTTPAGSTETVRGFYYEGFLHDPQIADMTRALTPYGQPCFKVRYCPRSTGRHTMAVSATVEGRTISLPGIPFTAQAARPGYRGFVRRDAEHPKYLAWEDGSHFWGIGLNVRSPFDLRYLRVAPYSVWRDEGLPLYARLFQRYREAGIDMVEVWMSSWWLALEWINDAPGFHGVGYYNPYRAWMLDAIIEEAEKNGIQLLLVFHNHGKFGALNDTEWARSPYNTANGGFLANCEEYFSNDRARATFRQLCDYIVARWGASPNILTWKLFTEIDLTGTSYDFYTNPVMAEWHREMGAYLKQIDLYDHLVTTHWMLGYHRINDAVATLPELDFLTTDAYYQGGGTAQLLAMLRGGNEFAAGKQKPLLITEYGGSPHADSMGNLIRQAHLGIWTGFFHEAPATPMFWWFALIDEKDLYGFHTALRRYSDGEDRRGLRPALREIPSSSLVINELRDNSRLFAWGFDAAYYLSDAENLRPATHVDTLFETPALAAGDYTVELWDVARGQVAETRPLTVRSGEANLAIPLPQFEKDFALKIRPAVSE